MGGSWLENMGIWCLGNMMLGCVVLCKRSPPRGNQPLCFYHVHQKCANTLITVLCATTSQLRACAADHQAIYYMVHPWPKIHFSDSHDMMWHIQIWLSTVWSWLGGETPIFWVSSCKRGINYQQCPFPFPVISQITVLEMTYLVRMVQCICASR